MKTSPLHTHEGSLDYRLYLCTDRVLMSTATIEDSVEQALAGGCTVVQLREKCCSSREFYELAQRVKRITDAHAVPLIINDRVDIALAAGAAGVHVGQEDVPATIARVLIGDGVLGVSVSTEEEAIVAEAAGADYLGVGALYATETKTDARVVTLETLAAIRRAVDIPLVAIGGINKTTIPKLAGSGIDGVAVVSAILAQRDITASAKELLSLFNTYVAD